MSGFMDSVKGIGGGLVIILLCICGLAWNENNNVKNIKGLEEAAGVFVQVPSDTVDPANDGKLIATNGDMIVADEAVKDDVFGVSVKTAKLSRTVEMYQWNENVQEDKKNNKTYEYEKLWSEYLVDSSHFNDQTKKNPTSMPVTSQIFLAKNVTLGAFTLTDDEKKSLSAAAAVTNTELPGSNDKSYITANGYYTTSKNDSDPQVGDVRVSYTYNNSPQISVMAQQQGNTFANYVTKSGVRLNRVEDGIKTGAEIITIVQDENNMLKWAIRIGATIILMLGISIMLKPLSVAGAYIPIVGSLVGAATGIISFILGLCISLTVIAIAWIAVRPILGAGMLAAVVLLLFVLGKLKKSNG